MKRFSPGTWTRRVARLAVVALAAVMPLELAAQEGLWTSSGQDRVNSRSQGAESGMNPGNAPALELKWVTTVTSDISATPAVDGEAVYVPDWGGSLFRIDRETGAIEWQTSVAGVTGLPGNFARTTPAISGDLLILGDQGGRLFAGARVFAVHKDTGALIWSTAVDTHPAAIVTQSATVHDGKVFVGVASFEEAFAAFIPGYPCCSFRGSLTALDVETGQILWKTYMSPQSFSGNAVWGSAPAVDLKRRQVYVATGNNYSAPQSFLDCVAAAGEDTDAQLACLAPYPDNYFDAVVALDMDTGAVRWATRVIPFDVWTVECLFELPGCPEPEGPDFDFGQAPMLMKLKGARRPSELVGVGQKSGTFWALDPDTGEVVWSTNVSPGGVAGGLQWGSSFDGNRIYTSSANSEGKPHVLPTGDVTTAGIWSALDPATGEILWQTANPAGERAGGAASSTANGLVFVCSLDPEGRMYALDGATGAVRWGFASGGSCNSGAAIAGGKVFWGSGYAASGFDPAFTGSDKLYAFGLR